LANQEQYKEKYEAFMNLVCKSGKTQYSFIISYMDYAPKTIKPFIQNLIKSNKEFWVQLKNDPFIDDSKMDKIIKVIFEFAHLSDLAKLSDIDGLEKYLENKIDFVEFATSIENGKTIEDFIVQQDLKVTTLSVSNSNNKKIYDLIYENNNYEVNSANLISILNYLGIKIENEKYQKSNFTYLREINSLKLLDYLSNNFAIYIENVFLELPENQNESEEIIIQLLNNDEIALALKEKIMKKQELILQNLGDIDDFEVKKLLIEINNVFPSWENVVNYIDASNKFEIDEALVAFLEFDGNASTLSNTKKDLADIKDEDYIQELYKLLIYNIAFEVSTYADLIKSIDYTYDELEFDNIDIENIRCLIQNKNIALNLHNFSNLKEKSNGLHILLVKEFKDEFIKTIGDYVLHGDDFNSLFKLDVFNDTDRVGIFKNLPSNLITSNEELAETVCNGLPVDIKTEITHEEMFAMIKSNSSIEKKLVLLNMNLEKYDDTQIQAFTEILGEDFKRVFVKANKPVFPNIEVYLEFFEKLKGRGLIKSVDKDYSKTEIRVVAKYR
jgi:hypothetical protein